jgi:hypothetical protein
VARFEARCGELATRSASDPQVRRANAAIRRLARLLVPVNFTTGPQFFHDPAETIPPLPDLAVAQSLAGASVERKGFIRTHLVRGQNRLVAALVDARTAVEEAMA